MPPKRSATVKKATATRKPRAAAKATKKTTPPEPVSEPEPVVTPPATATETAEEAPVKLTGPEIVQSVRDSLVTLIANCKEEIVAKRAYLATLNATLNTLKKHKSARKRQTPHKRNPTQHMDKEIIAFLKNGMEKEDFVVTRTSENVSSQVDLSDLTTSTLVMRTDVTQLLTNYIQRNNLSGSGTKVEYTKDPAFVDILTSGNIKEKDLEMIEQIKDGSLELTLFLMQRFIGQHLSKASKDVVAAAAAASG